MIKSDPIIIIPARMESTRLPNKPMADIHGEPMIVHCLKRALEADLGPVLVAASHPIIVDAVTHAGGIAILTDPNLPSGSDRVYAALTQFDPQEKYQTILNLQGDLPALPPSYLQILNQTLNEDYQADISTLASPASFLDAQNPNMVKAIAGIETVGQSGLALAFSRMAVPWFNPQTGDKDNSHPPPIYLHHIGLYGWRRAALKKFVKLPPSVLEKRERLEQMRALEAGLKIRIAMVASCPAGVDTQAELEQARDILNPANYQQTH